MRGFITVKEASERLNVTVRRVQALITDGRLKAEKMGSFYVINESDLALVAERKTGRPKKEGAAAINSMKSPATKRGAKK